MTAATVTTNVEVNDPTREVVVLTVSTGETYTSKKFGTITSALATLNEASGVTATDLIAGFSGATVTITYTDLTDKLVTLQLTGRK
jgi:hypothetical protein